MCIFFGLFFLMSGLGVIASKSRPQRPTILNTRRTAFLLLFFLNFRKLFHTSNFAQNVSTSAQVGYRPSLTVRHLALLDI
jgi:hypothetical protein